MESVERFVAFYVDKLGFVLGGGYAEVGCLLMAQLSSADCAQLLNYQQPDKCGPGRMFVSLDLVPQQTPRCAHARRRVWGDAMIVGKPDGAGLLFPYPQGENAVAGPPDYGRAGGSGVVFMWIDVSSGAYVV